MFKNGPMWILAKTNLKIIKCFVFSFQQLPCQININKLYTQLLTYVLRNTVSKNFRKSPRQSLCYRSHVVKMLAFTTILWNFIGNCFQDHIWTTTSKVNNYNNLNYALQSIFSELLGIIVSGLLYESFNVSTFNGYEIPLCSMPPYDEVQYVFW